jgi:hypothetical protein
VLGERVDMADLVGAKLAQGVLIDGIHIGQPVGLGSHGVLHWSFLLGPRRTRFGEWSALHRAPCWGRRDDHIWFMPP